MPAFIVGIAAYEQDSASAIICDGEIVAAAQESWFTKTQNDAVFPANALRYCLDQQRITVTDLKEVVFYQSSLLKFERLLETYLTCAPKGFGSFVKQLPSELKHTLFLKQVVRRELSALGGVDTRELPPIYFARHQHSCAAAAFYSSPFTSAAVLTVGSGGEWSTSSLHCGDGSDLELEWEINYPHSIGLLCSAFSSFCGLSVSPSNSELWRLAAHGEPRYEKQIYQHLIDIKRDGSFRLNMTYFNCVGGKPEQIDLFSTLFSGPRRESYNNITQREVDLAASIQRVVERVVLRLARSAHKDLAQDYLCLTGEIAHNYASNTRVSREGPFQKVWVQPAVGQSGSAVGAALAGWYQNHKQQRPLYRADRNDVMKGGYLGPSPGTDQEIRHYLRSVGGRYVEWKEEDLIDFVATRLSIGSLVGWVQGRMALGVNSLGARCILADPRNRDQMVRNRFNLIKNTDEFLEPVPLAVLKEDVSNYFDFREDSPYMSFLSTTHCDLDKKLNAIDKSMSINENNKVNDDVGRLPQELMRTSRIQTVDPIRNPVFHRLLSRFKVKTGCGMLINDAFNLPQQAIVCNVADAYRSFLRMDLDLLIVGNFLLNKDEQ